MTGQLEWVSSSTMRTGHRTLLSFHTKIFFCVSTVGFTLLFLTICPVHGVRWSLCATRFLQCREQKLRTRDHVETDMTSRQVNKTNNVRLFSLFHGPKVHFQFSAERLLSPKQHCPNPLGEGDAQERGRAECRKKDSWLWTRWGSSLSHRSEQNPVPLSFN